MRGHFTINVFVSSRLAVYPNLSRAAWTVTGVLEKVGITAQPSGLFGRNRRTNPDSQKTFGNPGRAQCVKKGRITEQIINQKVFRRVFGTAAAYSNLPEWPPKTLGNSPQRWGCPGRALGSLFPAEVILTSARMRNL